MESNSSTTVVTTQTSPLTTTLSFCQHYNDCTLSTVIGLFLMLSCSLVIALIALVIYAQFKSGNLSKNGSPIFILSTWSLLGSILLLSIIGFYVGPSIAFQFSWPDSTPFGENRQFSFLIAQSMISLIVCGSLFNIVIAINRAMAMGFTKTNLIFSRKVYNIIAMIIFPTGFAIGFIPPLVFYCCKAYYIYIGFTFIWDIVKIDPVTKRATLADKLSYYWVYRVVYIAATIIPILCYTYIFGFTIWTKRQMKAINASVRTELIRSLLFAMIFFFYMCSWMYYELAFVDGVIPDIGNAFYINIISMIFILIEAGMNGILQATMIKTVRRTIRAIFKKEKISKKTTGKKGGSKITIQTITVL